MPWPLGHLCGPSGPAPVVFEVQRQKVGPTHRCGCSGASGEGRKGERPSTVLLPCVSLVAWLNSSQLLADLRQCTSQRSFQQHLRGKRHEKKARREQEDELRAAHVATDRKKSKEMMGKKSLRCAECFAVPK